MSDPLAKASSDALGVQFSDVSKRYDRHMVLRDINIDIGDRELIVFVGPSGCGKSTLLRMLAGLEETTSGTIRIKGKPVNDDPPRERDIAMVFQSYALYPHMTVGQNIAFPLRMVGEGREQQRAKVENTARLLGLTDYLDRYPRHLSGGQRQRVAMGRAIVRDPAVFLFDEPLSNLDAALRVQMREEILALHRQIPATMIYVTHDQVEAMTLADRIVVLSDGEVQQIGTPHEIYNTPQSRFVAEFVGSPKINILPAKAEARGRHSTRVTLSPDCVFDADFDLPDGSGLIDVGVRPEALTTGEGALRLSGTVSHGEYLGATKYVYADVSLLADSKPCRLVVAVPPEAAVQTGQAVTIGFDPAQCHFFAADGSRL